MRQAALVCGAILAVLLASWGARAQTLASDSATSGPASFSSANSGPLFAQLEVPTAVPSFAIAAAPMPAFQKDAPPAGSGADVPPQGVYGVFPSYKYQIFIGYSFLRFYVVPGSEVNTNGLDFSIAYYFRDRIAVDGEMAVTLGTYTGENSEAFIGMGGLRYRHPMDRFDLWIHGMAGETHFSPQTAFGGEDGFGYEVGGGLDYTPRRLRLSWRVQADMVGSHLYGTYQYSPKISVGLVYKD